MKKIQAIVRPERLDAIKNALSDAGIRGLTVSNVTGRGQQRTVFKSGRGASIQSDMLQRIKIEVVIASEEAQRACDVIRGAAATGQVGDGKIFVLPVDSVVRIRTGEADEEAL